MSKISVLYRAQYAYELLIVLVVSHCQPHKLFSGHVAFPAAVTDQNIILYKELRQSSRCKSGNDLAKKIIRL